MMGLKVSPGALHPRRIVMRSTGAGRRIVIRPSASGGSGGGVTDHGALTGLGDDDHPQYALADGTRGAFATTAQGDLADTAVQPSALSDAITAHTAATDPHGDRAYTDAQIIASLANFVAGAPGILDTWLEMVTAIQADQTGLAALTTVVAGKLAKASNLSDLADIPTARTNLGLGSAATTSASAYDAAGTAAAAQAAAIAAAATDATAKANAMVADAINDGTTTVAPSQNAVFDALALKVPTSRTLAGLDLSADRTASTLRTALSLVPGTDVQAYDADLGQIAAATFSNDDFVQKKAGSLTNRTIAQVKADLGIGGPLRPTAPAGSWWELAPSHSDIGTAGTFGPSTASSNGRGVLAFVPMSHDQPIDGITFWLNGANGGASASARLMLWAADAGSHHGPGAAIPAPSAIGSANGAAGERVVTWSTPVVLPAPGFWFALVPQDLDTSGTNPAFWVYPNIGERRGWSPSPAGNCRTPLMTVTGLTTGETPNNPTVSTTFTNGPVCIAAVSVRSAT